MTQESTPTPEPQPWAMSVADAINPTDCQCPPPSSEHAPLHGWQHMHQSAKRRMARAVLTVTHHGFAVLGIITMLVLLAQMGRTERLHGDDASLAADARPSLLSRSLAFMGMAAPAATEDEDDAPEAMLAHAHLATDISTLTRQQASITRWISSKYRVAPEPVGLLVKEAFVIGEQYRIDPELLLAVMAIESRFNPFAQSHVGAQGLMQVMTHIHTDKYDPYGGNLAAFNPVSNLRVGARVLKETIARAGSLRGGLKYYVGAANLPTDQGYGDKVLAEYARIHAAAQGQQVAANASIAVPEKIGRFTTVVAQTATADKASKPTVEVLNTANAASVTHAAADQPAAASGSSSTAAADEVTVSLNDVAPEVDAPLPAAAEAVDIAAAAN